MRPEATLSSFTVNETLSSYPSHYGWGIKALNVPETWKITEGDEIVVYVIDTGMPDHFNLEGAIDLEKSRGFHEKEPDIKDLNGHSTHCCGVVGARDIGKGMIGVAPKCKIVIGKALDKTGCGGSKRIAKALNYAKELKPDVISMSIGLDEDYPEIKKAVQDLYKLNIPLVVAAGNDGSGGDTINYPAAYPEVICVTAYREDGKFATFSSRGKEADFAAPGEKIFSTWKNQQYAYLSGTSMATPFVAGLIALLISKHKKQERETGSNDCKTIDQIKEHLIKYSDDMGVVGWDNKWGYGIIDPVKMIQDLQKSVKKEEIKEFSWVSWIKGIFAKIKGLFHK